MVMPPASLSAAGSLTLPLFSTAAFVVFGAAVMDVVPTVLTGVTIIICLLSCPNPIPVSVAVVAARLVRCRRLRRVSGGLTLPWHARLVMMVLMATHQRPIARLNNQRPVKVGLHIGPYVEGRGQPETLLRLQLTVESLAARTVLLPQLVGPLLPH